MSRLLKVKKSKKRDIKFFSPKNDCILCVHTEGARKYAGQLESDGNILSYCTDVAFRGDQLPKSDMVGIRADYFKTEWAVDFYICYQDNHIGIREIINERSFRGNEKANVEKLELSRRYWHNQGVTDWKAVWMGVTLECLSK